MPPDYPTATLKVEITPVMARFLDRLVAEGKISATLDGVVQFFIANEIRRWQKLHRRPL